MLLKIGNDGAKLRLGAKVETEDSQYDIVDFGYQHPDGGIDSVAVGGSFYSLKQAIKKADASESSAPAATTEPVVQGVVMQPVVNYDGVEQDIEGL